MALKWADYEIGEGQRAEDKYATYYIEPCGGSTILRITIRPDDGKEAKKVCEEVSALLRRVALTVPSANGQNDVTATRKDVDG